MTQDPLCTYAHVWLIKEAAEQAKSADPKAIRDALAKIDLTSRARRRPRSIRARIQFDERGRRVGAVPDHRAVAERRALHGGADGRGHAPAIVGQVAPARRRAGGPTELIAVRRHRSARRRRLRPHEHRPRPHLRRHARGELRPGRLHDAGDVPHVLLRGGAAASIRCSARSSPSRPSSSPGLLVHRVLPRARHRRRRSEPRDGRPAHPHPRPLARHHQRHHHAPDADAPRASRRPTPPRRSRVGPRAPQPGAHLRLPHGAPARGRGVRLPHPHRSRQGAARRRRRPGGGELPGHQRARPCTGWPSASGIALVAAAGGLLATYSPDRAQRRRSTSSC